MKKILFTKKPILTSFSIYGMVTSLLPEDDLSDGWVYNRFVNLRFLVNEHVLFFDQYHSLLSSCPFVSDEIVTRETAGISNKKIFLQNIIDRINRDEYIFLYCDRYFISSFEAYQKINLIHELFVYGYDDDEKCFYCLDNANDGKFKTILIDFDEFYDSVNICIDTAFNNRIHFLSKKCWWCEEELDEKHIINQFINYRDSVYVRNIHDPFSRVNYGFYVHYDVLNDLISDIKKHEVNIPSFMLLWEHKKMMSERFERLGNIYSNPKYLALASEYLDLSKRYQTLKSIILKGLILKDEKSFQRILDVYRDNIDVEKTILSSTTNQLLYQHCDGG